MRRTHHHDWGVRDVVVIGEWATRTEATERIGSNGTTQLGRTAHEPATSMRRPPVAVSDVEPDASSSDDLELRRPGVLVEPAP